MSLYVPGGPNVITRVFVRGRRQVREREGGATTEAGVLVRGRI